MKRSPGIIPITFTEIKRDEFEEEWVETTEIGHVHTQDILELMNGMDKIWTEIRR